jgi:hypothetical protein
LPEVLLGLRALQELQLLRIQTALTPQVLQIRGLEKLEAQVQPEVMGHGLPTQRPLALQEDVAVQVILEVLAPLQRYQLLHLEALEVRVARVAEL